MLDSNSTCMGILGIASTSAGMLGTQSMINIVPSLSGELACYIKPRLASKWKFGRIAALHAFHLCTVLHKMPCCNIYYSTATFSRSIVVYSPPTVAAKPPKKSAVLVCSAKCIPCQVPIDNVSLLPTNCAFSYFC